METTDKKLKAKEMASHIDSHTHLVSAYSEDYGRPILVDVPVTNESGGLLVDPSLCGILAASVDKTSILILDLNSANDVTAVGAHIQYIVSPSEPKVNMIEDLKDGYPRHYYQVDSIEEALKDIKEKLFRVSEFADVNDPFKLEKNLWTYMATREIRIIGNYRHVAKGIQYAEVLQTHRPAEGIKTVFSTRTTGKVTFKNNNLARILNVHNELAEKFELLVQASTEPVTGDDPYLNWAITNAKVADSCVHLGVDFEMHYKNKQDVYRIEDIPDSESDLLIMDYPLYKEWNVENAFVILIDSDNAAVSREVTSPKVLAVMNSKFGAVGLVMAALRALRTNPDQECVFNLKGITNVHVFNNIITDAY